MAAMYAPTALEPARWIPGDGFQLQPGGPPYRILKRQKFEFLPAREVLIFEGCRALYRLPGQADWVWDGALRVWVQVNFAPPDALIRRATSWLCGPAAAETGPPAVAAGAAQNAALNILPEVLDRTVQPEFEVVILDLRGGQTLSAVQADGWLDPMVAAPFTPAGALAIARRLLELNLLLSQSGLCLAQLHPDQVMIDGNLNIRVRGVPLLAAVQADGGFAPADRAALAGLAVPSGPAPGGWLMYRWLAAFVQYLATGRYSPAAAPDETRLAAFFEPGLARKPELWEFALFHALLNESRAGSLPLSRWLGRLAGTRHEIVLPFSREALAASAAVLWRALEKGTWDEVLRLATETSLWLPEMFQAAAADAAARESLQASAEFQEFNRLLDQIAYLEHACVHAADLAEQTSLAGGGGGDAPAPVRSAAPSHLTQQAPLPPPRRSGPTAPSASRIVDAYGVLRERGPAAAVNPSTAEVWESPLRSLARALADLPVFPAFQSRLAAWLDVAQPRFAAAWLEPPLTPAERTTLQRHAPALLARLPVWLAEHTAAARQELTAAAAACAANGARELPRFEQAVHAMLRFAAALDLSEPDSVAKPAPTDLWPPPLAAVNQAIEAVETSGRIDTVILARMLSARIAEPAQPHGPGDSANQRSIAFNVPRLAALHGLHTALTSGAQAVSERRWFDALRILRPALDAWPQFPALQAQWEQTLQHGLTEQLAALQTAGAPGSDPSAVDPALVAGLVDLLQGPDEANRRWLGPWAAQIRLALEHFFTLLAAPAARAWPLDQRLAALAALRQPFTQFAPAAAAAWEEHLALTLQRRQDLATALENSRAQAALGKLLALWASGEAALPPPAQNTPSVDTDLGPAVLRLWLEQTTNAIEQLAGPLNTATLAGLYERMLGPLHKLREQHFATAAIAKNAGTEPRPGTPTPLSITARDLDEAVQAIETDLYHRMLTLAGRDSDLEPWLAAWAGQSFTPMGAWWNAVRQPAPRRALTDFLNARLALSEHRLEDAYHALVGDPPAAAGASAAGTTGPADLDRFRPVVPAALVATAVENLLEPWQRLQATAARARARVDLDGAAAQVAQDLTRARRLRDQAFPILTTALQELQQQINVRDAARARVALRQTDAARLAESAQLTAAVRELQSLKTDWPAAGYPQEQLVAALETGRAGLRRGLATLIDRADRSLSGTTDAVEESLSYLQAAAAALEADQHREFFNPAGEGTDGGAHWETALAGLFRRCLTAQNHRSYGVALLSGLQSGALPADAPFWAAVLHHDRHWNAAEPAAASAPQLNAAGLARLAQLPTGAVGPDEWQAWVAETSSLYDGSDGAALTSLAARLKQKSEELHADDERLSAALAGGTPSGPVHLSHRAQLLQQFTDKWRNGQQPDRRRAELDTLRAQAQTALDAALEPPAANALIRPFVHWRNLRTVAEEARVVGAVQAYSEALHAARRGWLWRLAIAVALVIGSAAAALVWL